MYCHELWIQVEATDLPSLTDGQPWSTGALKSAITVILQRPAVRDHLQHRFFPGIEGGYITLTDAEVQQAGMPSHWKRREKYRADDTIVRIFECTPFHGDLGAIVHTDLADQTVVSIDIGPVD